MSVGAIDLGLSPAGTRICKEVRGRAETEVRDKLRRASSGVAALRRPSLRWRTGLGRGGRVERLWAELEAATVATMSADSQHALLRDLLQLESNLASHGPADQ
jgi:hypothetical protein